MRWLAEDITRQEKEDGRKEEWRDAEGEGKGKKREVRFQICSNGLTCSWDLYFELIKSEKEKREKLLTEKEKLLGKGGNVERRKDNKEWRREVTD